MLGRAHFLPDGREDLETLLHAFILENAVCELGCELNSRTDWAIILIAKESKISQMSTEGSFI